MNDGGIKKHPSKYHGKKYHRQIQLNPQELRTVAWEVRSESRFADRKSESVSDDYIGARRRSIKSQLQVLQIRTLNRASSSWRCAATLRLPTMALKLRTALGAKLWTPNFGNVAVALLYAQRVHAHCRYPQLETLRKHSDPWRLRSCDTLYSHIARVLWLVVLVESSFGKFFLKKVHVLLRFQIGLLR